MKIGSYERSGGTRKIVGSNKIMQVIKNVETKEKVARGGDRDVPRLVSRTL